jgi:hypothetical protein
MTICLCATQTEMGGDTATRAAEDGAKAIAWAYISPKVRRSEPCRLNRHNCSPPP